MPPHLRSLFRVRVGTPSLSLYLPVSLRSQWDEAPDAPAACLPAHCSLPPTSCLISLLCASQDQFSAKLLPSAGFQPRNPFSVAQQVTHAQMCVQTETSMGLPKTFPHRVEEIPQLCSESLTQVQYHGNKRCSLFLRK